MIHNLTSAIENLTGSFSPERTPILIVDSGDEIRAQTKCCWWGEDTPGSLNEMPRRIPLEKRKDPINDTGMPLIGPISVRGAEPGMTLEVEVLELQVGSYGRTTRGGGSNPRYTRLGLGEEYQFISWQFDNKRGIATTTDGYSVELRPFLGCMGVPLDVPGHLSNRAAYQGGGNMDCKELVVGTKLYLPIAVPGAQFCFGDGHAAQGDGESGDAAIECPMDMVKLKLTLRDDVQTKWPIADTPSGWITFGFHKNLDEALYIALENMIEFVMKRLEVSREEAAMLTGVAADLRITQIVNPTVGVHAVLPHGSLISRFEL